jgi:hypothetical protein
MACYSGVFELVSASSNCHIETVDTSLVVYGYPIVRYVIDPNDTSFLVGHSNRWQASIQSEYLRLPLFRLYLALVVRIYPMQRVALWFGTAHEDVISYIRPDIYAVVIVSKVESTVTKIQLFGR